MRLKFYIDVDHATADDLKLLLATVWAVTGDKRLANRLESTKRMSVTMAQPGRDKKGQVNFKDGRTCTVFASAEDQ